MEEILQRLHAAYKSFDNPEFFFVGSALDNNPYQDLVQEIRQWFEVEEDTDPNDDVSFGYLLSQGEQQWVLRLSMVGPFAVLDRIGPSNQVDVIGPTQQLLSPAEDRLVGLVSSAGIRLLDKREMETTVPLHLDGIDGDTRLYQALFTATDVLPWEA